MPLYAYKCEKCSHEFEVIQKFSDEPIKECEKCLGPVNKLLSMSSNFSLKGGGWYNDGYSGKSNKKDSKPEPTSGGGHSCCGSGCAGC